MAKGICFKEPLFYATIEGRKTQTRRIITPQPDDTIQLSDELVCAHLGIEIKPKYKVGDTVYLKEPYLPPNNDRGCVYRYGMDKLKFEANFKKAKWKNKLFMPEFAARYFIEITGVRAEKLQDISDEDCIKEGIEICKYDGRHYVNDIWGKSKLDGVWEKTRILYDTPQEAYAALINEINGKGTWQSNPFVWVYDYKLID